MKEPVNIICISNQLSGSCIVHVFAERCFQRDNNLRRAGGGPIIKQHWKKIAEFCHFMPFVIKNCLVLLRNFVNKPVE